MDINYYKKFEPIDGKWYIKKEIGSGAFGSVFEVERNDFATIKAAMKIISIPSSQSEVTTFKSENFDLDEKSITSYFYGFVEEFVKEFQLMSELRGHSNIVSYEDHEVIKRDDEIGWDIFIRMELLTPMNDYFSQNQITNENVIKLAIDICKALEVCQEYKIIHRDIKPSNIFVSKTGDFKLGDFGVARTLEKTSGGLSKKGTYTYMAPEVYKGEEYGPNVDIYSLGIVMYRLMNNNMEPFRTDRTYINGEEALARRLKGERIEKPVNAEEKLAKIILKACEYNPKERYLSPKIMREDLEDILYESRKKTTTSPMIHVEKSISNIDINDSENTVSMFSQRDDKITADTLDNNSVEVPDDAVEKTVGLFEQRRSSMTEAQHVKSKQLKDLTREGPIFVDEEHKNHNHQGTSASTTVTAKKEPISLFKNIDDYDDELKNNKNAIRKPNLKPSTKKYSYVSSDSGNAFRRMDENDEELKRMEREKANKKKTGIFKLLDNFDI